MKGEPLRSGLCSGLIKYKNTLSSTPATKGSSKPTMAERVGFEPTVGGAYAGFQDRYLQPLGHLSSLAYYSMRRSRTKDEGCFHRYTLESYHQMTNYPNG